MSPVKTVPSETVVTELADRLRGRLLRPDDDGYDEARSIWNAMIEVFAEYGEKIPTPATEIGMAHVGGAVNDVPAGATAYPHRDTEFVMNLHTHWTDPEQDEACIGWARDLHEAMTPHATGGVYVNFVPEGEGDPQAVYRENYDRMVEVKTKWDPENLFRLNHNVEPAR